MATATGRSVVLAVLVALPYAGAAAAQADAASREVALQRAATAKANEAEHRRELDELHLTATRPGVSHNESDPNVVNYVESKAVVTDANVLLPGTLPPVLRFQDGKPVRSAKDWVRRRAELLALFDSVELGVTPVKTPAVRWRVLQETTETQFGHAVKVRRLAGVLAHEGDPTSPVTIALTLVTPQGTTHVPVVLEFTWPSTIGTTPASQTAGPSWQEQVLQRGWAYAEYQPYTVQPDSAAGLIAGVIGLTNHGQPRSVNDWGVLKAWAWGASRVLDYFGTDADVDAKRVAIEGHSRFGKAALVAMAYDERFAVAFLSSAGAGGTNLWRRSFGEQLENVEAAGEFHWMGAQLLRYAADPLHAVDLPLDQHELIALCAPRPVFVSGGADGDKWIDPHGMFLATVAASPVWTLLGKRGLSNASGPVVAFPAIETPLVAGDLAYRQHTGGHTPVPNWPVFLDFAARYF